MRISAKADYALRALVLLAELGPDRVTLEALTTRGAMPRKFLEGILSDLRHADLVHSRRGTDGGYTLAVPARQITIGQVIRAMDGPLVAAPVARSSGQVHPSAKHLDTVWVAMAASLAEVLDRVTVDHLLSGRLPAAVVRLASGGHQSAPTRSLAVSRSRPSPSRA
ncbi:MAG: Rrf2 family transcriptional regulator [Kineosporiaceae bacterium]